MLSRTRTSLSGVSALILGLLLGASAYAQPQGVDCVVAKVGGRIILYSELAGHLEQERQNGAAVDQTSTCSQLEDLLFEELLLVQAAIDSVVVDDNQVDAELDRRLRYFEQQIGGRDKLEKFYGKSIAEIKHDFHDQVYDQLLTQQMHSKISGDVRVTPKEVEKFYASIPKDSLPFINAGIEFARLTKYANPSEAEDRRVRKKLEDIRERILKGEDFCVFAGLYSEDPGSKDNCGQLGLVPQGVMVPEFDAVALSLKEGELSQVFKTEYGYHLMQLVERKGEMYNARHILISPKVLGEDRRIAQHFMDSVVTMLRSGQVTIANAAVHLNDDEDTRGTNGTVIEPNSNSPHWATGDLDQRTFLVLDQLKVGEWSEPRSIDAQPGGKEGYEILCLQKRTEPHVLDLVQDYPSVAEAAEGRAKQKVVDEWIKDKLVGTWVQIIPDYASCPFRQKWISDTAP